MTKLLTSNVIYHSSLQILQLTFVTVMIVMTQGQVMPECNVYDCTIRKVYNATHTKGSSLKRHIKMHLRLDSKCERCDERVV